MSFDGPVARDIADRNFTGLMEFNADVAHWRFNRVCTGLNPVEISEGGAQPQGPVPAHVEIAYVVEEDNACGVARIFGLTENRAYHRVIPTGFVHDGGTVVVEL